MLLGTSPDLCTFTMSFIGHAQDRLPARTARRVHINPHPEEKPMHINALIACAAAVAVASSAHAALSNPSFEDTGGWSLFNDADLPVAGGSANWMYQTKVVGLDMTVEEDVFATDGDFFAMTYAGGDRIEQQVTVTAAGTYQFSVDFNGILGRVDEGAADLMVDGQFRLRIGTELSDIQVADVRSGWDNFTFTTEIVAPGTYLVGIENTAIANYAIAYDNASFRLIPAPGAAALASVVGLAAIRRRR